MLLKLVEFSKENPASQKDGNKNRGPSTNFVEFQKSFVERVAAIASGK